jgi:riboflavin kinase/FMN adenylyltransferase
MLADKPLVLESLEQLRDYTFPKEGLHVAVGTFDGVHVGHWALVEAVRRKACEMGGASAVLTFQNHPRSVLRKLEQPILLTPWEEKRYLLRKLGVEILIGIPFTWDFSQMKAEDFISEVLVGYCKARSLHSGTNFHFGRGGRGGVELLRQMAEPLGYDYHPLELVRQEGEKVSSTEIREALWSGDVRGAARGLGRWHSVEGKVILGDQLGRKIGFPTANLELPEELLRPKYGVYAGWALHSGMVSPAVLNLGVRPTVTGSSVERWEVHLLDFSGDLYGERVRFEFVERLRDEQKFPGLKELSAQLGRDCEAARTLLQGTPLPER